MGACAACHSVKNISSKHNPGTSNDKAARVNDPAIIKARQLLWGGSISGKMRLINGFYLEPTGAEFFCRDVSSLLCFLGHYGF
jgi:hypothetical protein